MASVLERKMPSTETQKALRTLRASATPMTGVMAAALLLSACGSASTAIPAGPNWSLTDKPAANEPKAFAAPNNVGAVAAPAKTVATSPYEYRGGRDPVTGRAADAGGLPQAPPRASAGPASASRTATIGQPRTIEVQKGDTLHGLSLKHHVSVAALMSANGLTNTVIQPGRKLIVPGE
jgi:N-acetylmuramoyl-L-alanine amidase